MIKKSEKQQFIKAVATLVGTTIGAGVLAIPYAVYYASYWVGILYLIILGIVVTVLNLMLGEILLRTKKNLSIPELIKVYLGRKGYLIAFLAIFIVIYGALTAYIRAAGEIMNILIPANELNWSIVFFAIATYFIIKGLKFISKWEVIFVTGMFLIIMTLWMKSIYTDTIDWTQFRFEPISSFKNAIQPYGIILFSYFGVIAIPQMKTIFSKKNYHQLHSAINLSNAIIILVYSLFVSLVIGVVGSKIDTLSIISLGNALGFQALSIVAIFALLAIITTFISMGESMVESYMNFGNTKKSIAIILTTFPPLALLFFDWSQFNTMIQYAGGIGVSVIAILIVLTFWKSKVEGEEAPAYSLGHLKWVGISMIILFSFGIFSLFI
jgi:tyrosine-specific transport protein